MKTQREEQILSEASATDKNKMHLMHIALHGQNDIYMTYIQGFHFTFYIKTAGWDHLKYMSIRQLLNTLMNYLRAGYFYKEVYLGAVIVV